MVQSEAMNTTPHIAVVCPGFPADPMDTACVPYLYLYLEALQACRKCRISVVALQYPFRTTPFQWKGMDVFPMGGKNAPGLRRLPSWGNAWRTLRQIHRQTPVNIMHSFWMGEAAVVGSLVARRFRVPHIVTVMGQDARPENRWWRWEPCLNAQLVAVSHRQRSGGPMALQAGMCIPFGMDASSVEATSREHRTVDILGVGSLNAVKNFETFVDVVAALKGSYRVVVLGEGPRREDLMKQALSLGLTIEWKGAVGREEVLQWMSKSRVLLHTASFEGQGYAFVEALASGMQIVSTSVGAAESGPNWSMAEGVAALSDCLQQRLESAHSHDSEIPRTMDDTVDDYWKLYGV